MNRNDFLKMIEHSGPSDRTTIAEVNDLISIFPYFQSAYMLLLKGLQNTSDVKFENQLRLSATRIADREVLYYMLKKEPVKEELQEVRVQQTDSAITEHADNQQTVIESGKNSEDLINEIEKQLVQNEETNEREDYTVIVSDDMADDETAVSLIIMDEESGSVEEKITYMDPGISIPEAAELLELEHEEKENSPVEPAKTNLSNRQLQSELIDKFIIANPTIERQREKLETPNIDISTPYVEEKEGFVSETLARIYINQGYFSKAIDIYEKLSLKFPEKSSYFASQIEKVKELIKK
jgi:hypothetical protein